MGVGGKFGSSLCSFEFAHLGVQIERVGRPLLRVNCLGNKRNCNKRSCNKRPAGSGVCSSAVGCNLQEGAPDELICRVDG